MSDVGPEDGVVSVVEVDSDSSADFHVARDNLMTCHGVQLTNVFTVAHQQRRLRLGPRSSL